MTHAQIIRRQKAVAAAIGSVQAEGFKTSAQTKKRLQDYASGKITASELRKITLREVKASK